MPESFHKEAPTGHCPLCGETQYETGGTHTALCTRFRALEKKVKELEEKITLHAALGI